MKKSNNKGLLVAAVLIAGVASAGTYAASGDLDLIADTDQTTFNMESRGHGHHGWDLSEEDKALIMELKDQVKAGEISMEEMKIAAEEAGIERPEPDFMSDLTEDQKEVLEEIHALKIADDLSEAEIQAMLDDAGIEMPARHGRRGGHMRFPAEALAEAQMESLQNAENKEDVEALLEEYGIERPAFGERHERDDLEHPEKEEEDFV